MAESHADQTWSAYARGYYEHQYARVAALEDQGFRLSSLVLALTAAVLTFASQTTAGSLTPLLLLIVLSNTAAIVYVLRVSDSVNTHELRAKAMLKRMAPDIFELDQGYKQRFTGRLRFRPAVQVILHVLLASLSMLAMCT